MSRVTPSQANFNAGVLSRRLHARADLNIYDIGLAAGQGVIPLVEGGLDFAPGTIHVAAAAGPCRLIPFEYDVTQSYVVEASAGLARFYTNDARIEDAGDAIELTLPYSLAEIGSLMWEQSYDVLYLFHGDHQTRELSRVAADAFELNRLELKNGPFESRNDDESITVYASAVSGDVTLHAKQGGMDYALFAAGDVGGLFQIEADDFGDISSWEPGITVSNGQLLTWNERVYRVAGGSGRTGSVAPIHTEGVEWDGIGAGTDLNTKPAGGVQLEFICDRFGILEITGFTSEHEVTATVLRRLPFTAAASYTYTGGYYDGGWDPVDPPEGAVDYQYGTWRWRFGAFSDRRGWPNCGVVWNERLALAKGPRFYCSVAGDLHDFSTYNELGEISADEAFQGTIKDANGIVSLVADDKLLMVTASGMFALGPSNAAAGVGPTNYRVDRQNNEGGAAGMPVQLDGMSLYIGKSKRRVIEGGYTPARDKQEAVDLTRYARFVGQPRFTALASVKDPNRLIAACRGDGTLAFATYVPSEQVLGWVPRVMAAGVAARDIASISDPAGELNQLWIAAEYAGGWHVLRQDQFRQEDDAQDPVMTDLTFQYEGDAASAFGPVPLLAGKTVQVRGDAALYRTVPIDADGMFTLPQPAAKVDAGLAFDAYFTTLPSTAGSDNGAALGKMRRISQLMLDVLNSRGLQAQVQGNDWRDIELLFTDSTTDQGFEPYTGLVVLEDCGTDDRFGQISVRRVAPCGATVRAVRPALDMQQS